MFKQYKRYKNARPLLSPACQVTVLAVFSSLGANTDLYIMVFGESVLNDAVAMVLYNTVSRYMAPGTIITAASVMQGACRVSLHPFVTAPNGKGSVSCVMAHSAALLLLRLASAAITWHACHCLRPRHASS